MTYLEHKGEVKGAHASDIQMPGAVSQLRPHWRFPRPTFPQRLGAQPSGDRSQGVQGSQTGVLWLLSV